MDPDGETHRRITALAVGEHGPHVLVATQDSLNQQATLMPLSMPRGAAVVPPMEAQIKLTRA